MLISENLNLWRVLRYTWKVDLAMLAATAVTYFAHPYISPYLEKLPAAIVALIGSALAFFIGFSNNQAYDRWWEARTIWGALVNDSRTWARMVLTLVSGPEDIQRRMIRRHIGFVYALKAGLRGKKEFYLEHFLETDELAHAELETNLPNAIITDQARDLRILADLGTIDQFRYMQLTDMLRAFTDHMGKSERIRNTVFPTTYIYFTKLFIWLLIVFATLILSTDMQEWSILVGWIIGFVFHVSHQNGMTLMDPFEETPYGVPLNQISRTIEINLLQMMGDDRVPEPVNPVGEEYVL